MSWSDGSGSLEHDILVTQINLASTYHLLGRDEDALQLKRDVYFGRLKLNGEEYEETLRAANNYTNSLVNLRRDKEAKALLSKTIPVARRILGESHELTLRMNWCYAEALYDDDGATLDDVREAVTTLEDAERIARRVFGGAHPLTTGIEDELRDAQTALRARETPPSGGA